jgi:hypothetical protein
MVPTLPAGAGGVGLLRFRRSSPQWATSRAVSYQKQPRTFGAGNFAPTLSCGGWQNLCLVAEQLVDPERISRRAAPASPPFQPRDLTHDHTT